jgi:hypothetical protein
MLIDMHARAHTHTSIAPTTRLLSSAPRPTQNSLGMAASARAQMTCGALAVLCFGLLAVVLAVFAGVPSAALDAKAGLAASTTRICLLAWVLWVFGYVCGCCVLRCVLRGCCHCCEF